MTAPQKRTLSQAEALLSEAAGLQRTLKRQQYDGAEALLSHARKLIGANVNLLAAQAADEVAAYDGMPVTVNPFEVLGVGDSELAHSAMLRWLLDPAEAHGLGDTMLRRLLARHGSRAAAALAQSEAPLPAVVQTEIPLEEGRIDLLLALRGAVVGVEVKVWAEEGRLAWQSHKGAPQTTIYRVQLQNARARVEALRRMGPAAVKLAGSTPDVMMFFIRPRGRKRALDTDGTTTMSWLDVERDLALAMQRRRAAAEAQPLLRAFRSTLLERTGSSPPQMPRVAALRRLVDMPGLRQGDPLRTYLQLRALQGDNEEGEDVE